MKVFHIMVNILASSGAKGSNQREKTIVFEEKRYTTRIIVPAGTEERAKRLLKGLKNPPSVVSINEVAAA